MNAKTTRSPRGALPALALLIAATLVMLAAGQEATAQILPPLPPPSTLLPITVSLTSPTLAPPALPSIPSLPQVLPSNAPGPSSSNQLPVTSATLDAKLLIVSADGTEPVLGAIRQAADYEGIPYTLYIASRTPGGFTPGMLSDGGGHAYYQAIVLTTGTLAYYNGTAWTSALNSTEWQTLWDYQAKYRVRTGIAYAYPTADLGYGPPTGVDATTTPISARLTASGQSVFPYVNASNAITITKAWTYLAAATGTGTNVLLTDPQGDALALVRTYPDGRQVYSMTFDGNFFLVHSLVLTHGMLQWVTGGFHLGARHIYMTPQVDDVFIDDDVYGGGIYRISAADWTAVDTWQSLEQQKAQTSGLRLHMAFNGEGTKGIYPLDTLTPAADLTRDHFGWINHTFSHANLDSVDYDGAYQEIILDDDTADSLGIGNYDRRAMVTPDISGLSSPDAMSAAYDAGIRYLVTDTSRPGMDNPTPQAGIYNPLEPGILMIPRRPVNLFYNVTTPSEWVSEYNFLYHSYWGRDLTYDEILDKESDVLLQYVLRGEIDPWMFHQSNLRAYDGVHTLLGDLLDRTLGKYEQLIVLPVRNLTLAGLGEWTANRMQYNGAGVQCSFVPDQGTVTITASTAAIVPVTGLQADSSEVYGPEAISYVHVAPGQTVTYTMSGTTASQSTTSGVTSTGSSGGGLLSISISPNPLNPQTAVSFTTRHPGRVTARIYDASGRLVRTLADRSLGAGRHTLRWDGSTEKGGRAASGAYFFRLHAPDGDAVERLVVVK